MLQAIIKWLYIDKAEAKSYGWTHEGMAYGVPVYFDQRDEDDEAYAICPKVPLTNILLNIGETLMVAMGYMFPGQQVDAPIYMTAEL